MLKGGSPYSGAKKIRIGVFDFDHFYTRCGPEESLVYRISTKIIGVLWWSPNVSNFWFFDYWAVQEFCYKNSKSPLFYLPHMEYEGSIGFVMRKMKNF
jgi:hypothetical protein